MNYSNFLNKTPGNSKHKKVNNKNCYSPTKRDLVDKKNRVRYFLLFTLISLGSAFAFFNESTIKNNVQTAITDDNNLQQQTTILELPDIAHHSNDETKTHPKLDVKKESKTIVPTPSSKIIPESSTVKNPISQAKVSPLKKQTIVVLDNNVLDNKQSGDKHKVLIAETKSKSSITTESKSIIVKNGDSLSAIFKRLSLSANTLYKIINSDEQAKLLTKIKPGQKITINLLHNKFNSLHYYINSVDTLVVNKSNNAFNTHIESKDIEVRQQFVSATIQNSLFLAGNKAGLSSAMIMQMAQIFGWDIDFALDVRKGDSFIVLYEEKFINDKKYSNGHILSAEFINKGKSYTAVRFTDKSGHTDYYSEKGLSMRKAFLRTPVEFSRISSRFSYKRKHPVLNKNRPHKGVDYAASRGTPIKAVGKGKVIFKGTKGGYGRVIILQHGSKYSTLYAHMNSYNKKVRKGSQVVQGQTIGYVGSSGLATGPHLHYEFRVNGIHRNPLTVPLPTAAPIAKKYRNDFLITADTLISQLKSRKQEIIALKD